MKASRAQNLILPAVVCSIVAYFIFLQFLSPALYDPDSYYHIAVARFIRDYGPHYQFHWAQFSTFKEFFSDKDFLFHVLLIPFLYLSKNIILSAKLAAVFLNVLFLSAYAFILRKYVKPFFAACILILPVFSSFFSLYLLFLRPAILGNVFTILGVYFIIEKKWIKLFFLSFFYPLAHLSFLTLVIFVFICEITRLICVKEFFSRNILIVFLGIGLGLFAHPNYPLNLFSVYLNGFLTPIYNLTHTDIIFGKELGSLPSRVIFLNNLPIFFILNIILLKLFRSRASASFPTFAWWNCTVVYLILGFLSNRFWYEINILFFIFFASFFKDWQDGASASRLPFKVNISLVACFAVFFAVFGGSLGGLGHTLSDLSTQAVAHEDAGRWMDKNIPPGKTIYHARWADAPAFICLNPKDNYLLVLDPIYMYYPYPHLYTIYRALVEGRIAAPAKILRRLFKTEYGFVGSDEPLYGQVKKDTADFKILYENGQGIVFRIL